MTVRRDPPAAGGEAASPRRVMKGHLLREALAAEGVRDPDVATAGAGVLAPGAADRARTPSISRSGTSEVSRAVAIAIAARTLEASVYAATGTHPPAPSPAIAAAAVGAKPPIAKPICVPMATPDRRTRVGNISP